ncbi:MAG TPA: DUF6600 domain-containing protein, partial [Blastocatellia bacterium]|nr:DUF6600 domain-containing protein [Blastocatellia bacterium]
MKNCFLLIFCILALVCPLVAPVAHGQSQDQTGSAPSQSVQSADQSQAAQADTQQADPALTNSDDGQPSPRVARLFYVQGDVTFQPSGDNDWYNTSVNQTLLAGEQLYTGAGSRAIVQLGRTIFIWLAEKTDLSIAQLDDSTGEFEVPAGSIVIEARGLKSAFDLLEVDTPVSSVVLNEDGQYRVDVDDDGATVAMVRTGAADIASEDGGTTIHDGHLVRVGPPGSGQLVSANLDPSDDWGLIDSDRNPAALAQGGPCDLGSNFFPCTPDGSPGDYPPAPDYVNTYENTYDGLFGADELSRYGTWTYYSSYGNIWLPRVGPGWAPFRLGEWVKIRGVGWTWVSAESWGWAPYHHGRWAFIANLGWAWIPGFGPGALPFVTGPRFFAWNPGLVSFFTWSSPGGRFVGWTPAPPAEKTRKPKTVVAKSKAVLPATPEFANGLSVMPMAAFERSVMGRPAAPGAEQLKALLSISKVPANRRRSARISARIIEGLQDVHPARAAFAPARSGIVATAIVVQPPASVTGKTFLTRH